MPPFLSDGRRGPESRAQGNEVAGEDFLFHLYRGSELLQENRVHEAKEELESALRLQPLDHKGQDLLAVVYFRLGMYPRAIEIFEQLVRAYPEERGPRTNLALCYLKTGQPNLARQLLETTVFVHPDNTRAWGYLGLAYERLGDYDKAREAFSRGGHEGMSRRMGELAGDRSPPPPSIPPSAPPSEPFHEIEGEDEELDVVPVTQALRSVPPPGLGRSAPPQSLGRSAPPQGLGRSAPPPPVSLGAFRSPSPMSQPPPRTASVMPSRIPASSPIPSVPVPDQAPTLEAFVRDVMVVFPVGAQALLQPSGLVSVTVGQSFACRPGAVRSLTTPQNVSASADPMARSIRGKKQDEALGGPAPLASFSGVSHLLLGPTTGRKLRVFSLQAEMVFLREELLVGFDENLSYENGRLAVGDGEAAPMVQLRGVGAVVVETQGEIMALEVGVGQALTARREVVLGWVGRLVPRALLPSEAPASQRGLVVFSGEGLLLIDPR
jgi:hypothetical protein